MEYLVKLAMNHDEDAFMELMHSHMQSMYKVARSRLSSDEDVADAIQDTILACWEKIPMLQEPRFFKTWMTRILINKCNDILRDKYKVVQVDELPDIPASDLGFSNLEWSELMEQLGSKNRTVFVLYYIEGFKTSEIAQMLDISESGVRSRLARAREKLAKDYDSKIRKEESV